MKILQVDSLVMWNQSNVNGLMGAYSGLGDLVVFDYRRVAGDTNKQWMNETLVRLATDMQPDLVHIEKGEMLAPRTAELIRERTEAKIVHVFPDYNVDGPRFLQPFVPHVDWVLLTHADPVWIEALGGRNIAFWTRGVDPGTFYPRDEEKLYDVSMIANSPLKYRPGLGKGRRDLFVRALAEAGFVVHTFGRDTREQAARFQGVVPHDPVYMGEFAKVVSQTRISLAYNTGEVPMFCSWRRVFNTLATGGFLLIRYFPGLEKVLKNGKHLAWFGTWLEAMDLIRYYLDRPEERQRIAEQGQAEVLAHHTWEKRGEWMMNLAFRGIQEPSFARFA